MAVTVAVRGAAGEGGHLAEEVARRAQGEQPLRRPSTVTDEHLHPALQHHDEARRPLALVVEPPARRRPGAPWPTASQRTLALAEMSPEPAGRRGSEHGAW